MIKINLLPVKAAKKKEAVMFQLIVGVLVILLAFCVIGWRWYSQTSKIAAVQSQIIDTDKKIEKLKNAQKKFEELKRKKETLDNQIKAISQLDRGRDWFIRVLDKISESVPRKQLWLTETNLASGGKRKAKGRAKGGSILLKGHAYDRDAVAHFMGNLSMIPCDDELLDEDKAPICHVRNDKCRRWNDEEKNFEWDFEGCREFYKDVEREASACDKDVSSCKGDQNQICGKGQGKACADIKEKCKKVEKECAEYKQNYAKLHAEEYIQYDSVKLIYIKTKKGKDSASGDAVYDFEITCNPTDPPG